MIPQMILTLFAAAVGAILGAAGLYWAFWAARKKSELELERQKEELRGQFAAVSAEVLQNATEQFLALAQSRLETERVRSSGELDEKRQAVEAAVRDLGERLKAYEQLLRSFEADRERKYGSLEEQLRKTAQTTQELRTTTERLQAVLSNSRVRGQWGEKMAEDILRASGLMENVQYIKNRAQETAATRPDFAFLLPDGHKLHMDVKFPLDNYLRMVNAGSEEEKENSKTDFLRDVKARIKEVQKREYVNPQEKTLNYVLLFIPNEQIYGFLQEAAPGLVDEALAHKVVLTSPSSLYAVLSVVRQAFDNFYFTQATQEILKLVASFQQAYVKFKERFGNLGLQIEKVSSSYSEISGASYKALDQVIARIEKVRERGDAATSPELEMRVPGSTHAARNS